MGSCIKNQINTQVIEKKSYVDTDTINTSGTVDNAVFNAVLDVHSIFRTLQGEGPFTGHSAIFIRLAGCNLQCPACDTDYTSKRSLMSVQTIIDKVNTLKIGQTIQLIVITGGEPLRQNISDLCILLYQAHYTVQIETNGTLGLPKQLQYFLQHTYSQYVKQLQLGMNGAGYVNIDTLKNNKCINSDTFNYINELLTSEQLMNAFITDGLIKKMGFWFNIVCSPKTSKIHESLNPYIMAWKYILSANSIGIDGLPILSLQNHTHIQVARPKKGHIAPIYLQACDNQNETMNQLNNAACVDSCIKHGYIFQLQVHKYINIE